MTHAERMARFLAGHWTKERPTEEGYYPTRTSDGEELSPTQWQLVVKRPDGSIWLRTSWGGEFWSVPWPGMPGE